MQIFGGDIDAMIQSAKIVEEANPEIIDINFGC
ncbi:MAG: tRNA-dihydrouridine synthase [Chitinophagales bacterium]